MTTIFRVEIQVFSRLLVCSLSYLTESWSYEKQEDGTLRSVHRWKTKNEKIVPAVGRFWSITIETESVWLKVVRDKKKRWWRQFSFRWSRDYKSSWESFQ